MEQGGHARAVFVDPTGRRHRRVVRTAWLLAGLGAAYVGLVVVSLLLPPSLSRLTVPGLGPVLPGPAAAPLGQAEGELERPAVLLERSPSPLPRRARTSAAATPSPAARPLSPAAATSPAATSPTAAATPSRSAAATGRPTTAPTTPPGQSEPPGQATRSPRPRPTPSRGPR